MSNATEVLYYDTSGVVEYKTCVRKNVGLTRWNNIS